MIDWFGSKKLAWAVMDHVLEHVLQVFRVVCSIEKRMLCYDIYIYIRMYITYIHTICYACRSYSQQVLQWQWVTIHAMLSFQAILGRMHGFFMACTLCFTGRGALKESYYYVILLLEMTVQFNCLHFEDFYNLFRPAIFFKETALSMTLWYDPFNKLWQFSPWVSRAQAGTM